MGCTSSAVDISGLFLQLRVDTKARGVQVKLGVDVRFVACVAMYASPPLSARHKAKKF